MVRQIKQPKLTSPFVDEVGLLTQRNQELIRDVVELDVLAGTGSPEGNVVAKPKRFYMDLTGTPGNIVYIKRDADIGGDRSQGWILA